MDRRTLVLLACLCPGLALGAGPRRTEVEAAAARIRAHVAFLADDLLEGRAAGTRGYDLAARYVAAEFEGLGLRPGGVAGGWYQPIELIQATPDLAAGVLTLERDGRTESLASGVDFLPRADFVAPESSVTAPLEFVGFGVSAPERGYDDFAGVDLRGKIAVVLFGAPASFGTEARAHYSASLTKYAELVRRGAVGVIMALTPLEERRTPFERWVQRSWFPGMRWLGADGRPVDAFPELRRLALVGQRGAARLFAGAAQSLDQVYALAAEGRPPHLALPGRATLAGRTALERRRSANVIGLIEGADPVRRREYVVLSAHLDHLGRGAAVNGDAIYHGALDNAGGVAVMLEVAHMLRQSGQRPKRSVLFVALTGEERGLLGSDVFARQPTVAGTLVADINMDMPVALGPLADWVAFGGEHSTLGPIAARAAAAEGYALAPDPMPEEVVFVRSDQYMFVRQGVPSIYIDSGSRSKDPAIDLAARIDEFLRDHYHMPSDSVALPIDYPALAGLARMNARILREVADAPERPAWNAGDFFGAKFAPRR